MKKVYQRNTAYSFFLGTLLVFPTIALFYLIVTSGEFYVIGAIALVVVYLFMSFHFGIKFDEKNNQFVTYLGYNNLHIPKSLLYVIGVIAVVVVYLFISFHFRIKFDEKTHHFVTYFGYTHLHITQSFINISEIISYSKIYRKTKSTYDVFFITYDTSSKTCKLELTLNGDRKVELVTGTEKGIREIVEILDFHLHNADS